MATNPNDIPTVGAPPSYPVRAGTTNKAQYLNEVAAADARFPVYNNELNAATSALNAAADVTYDNAVEAADSASTATDQAGIAADKADEASASADLAEDWATSTTEVSGGLKGAKGYAEDAAAAVATLPTGTINDTVIAPDKAWSSQKISDELGGKESADPTILKEADIGIKVLAPDGDGSGLTNVTVSASNINGTLAETQIPTASSSTKGGVRCYVSGTTGYIYTSN